MAYAFYQRLPLRRDPSPLHTGAQAALQLVTNWPVELKK
jgi:hypothetical protein